MVGVWLHALLNLILGGDERSASRLGCVIPDTHWIESYMVVTTDLNIMKKRGKFKFQPQYKYRKLQE
jgi:hypothetical protein